MSGSDYYTAVIKTLDFEGGYVNDLLDSGGETNMGITQADLPGVDLKTLTRIDAIDFYRDRYWKPLYSSIESQAVAEKLFDMGVLLGVGTAVKLLQNAMNLSADGIFGQGTLSELNMDGEAILAPYQEHLRNYVMNLVLRVPKNKKFLAGWLRRIDA